MNGRSMLRSGMALALMLLSAVGCAAPASTPGRTRAPASPTALAIATPVPTVASVLPHSLYFLDRVQEQSQVWRMQTDGITRVQLTDEEAGIDSFAVSPLNGTLAFVTRNQLFLVDGDGQNRHLIADDSQLEDAEKGTYFHGIISDPVFSPDGRTLAYAFDGLHLYDLATGDDAHVLRNLGNLLGEPFVFDKEIYAPSAWSPDGSMLLFGMGYFEGSTLAVMEPAAQEQFRRLWSDGPVCCSYSWTADSRSVLVANPSYGVSAPGLWSFDAETGEETLLLGGMREDRKMDFVDSPFRLDSGDLLFFYVQLERLDPDVGILQQMVRSDPTGSNISPVRPEVFEIHQALWAPDGSLAVISGRCCGGSRQLMLAETDGSPLRVLFEAGEHRILDLAWGP